MTALFLHTGVGDSEESSDDEKPKCVIEIEGEVKKKPVERRGFHDPEVPNDDFAKELFNNIPKLQVNNTKLHLITQRYRLKLRVKP